MSNYNAESFVSEDTIFISGLPEETTEEQLEEYFGQIGRVKIDKKTKTSKIWIYKDKTSGKGKGEATLTFDDPPAASSAIKWFDGKEFYGSTISVQLAQRKTNPMQFQRGHRGGRGGGSQRFDGGRGGGFERGGNGRGDRGSHRHDEGRGHFNQRSDRGGFDRRGPRNDGGSSFGDRGSGDHRGGRGGGSFYDRNRDRDRSGGGGSGSGSGGGPSRNHHSHHPHHQSHHHHQRSNKDDRRSRPY